MIWRYDPILLSNKYTEEYHYEFFEKFCKRLEGYTNKCIISFIDLYRNVSENIKGTNICSPDKETRLRIASRLSEIGLKYNIQLESCSENLDLTVCGIKRSSCIDKKLIEDIVGYELDVKKDAGQRETCGCVKSIDIGQYNTCIHNCLYCYANSTQNVSLKNFKSRKKDNPLILGELAGSEKITEYKVKSIKSKNNNKQLNLLDLMY